jgi:hypothetical protein
MKTLLKFLFVMLLLTAFVVTSKAQSFMLTPQGEMCSTEEFQIPYKKPSRQRNWREGAPMPGFVMVGVFLPGSHRFPMPDTVVAFPGNTPRSVAQQFALDFYDKHQIDMDITAMYEMVVIEPGEVINE